MICGLWRLTVTSLTGRALAHSCIRAFAHLFYRVYSYFPAQQLLLLQWCMA